MLEKILDEMLKNGTVIDAYSQNNNGKIYSYYGIEYNDEIFEVMCIDNECKSIEKVLEMSGITRIIKIIQNSKVS